MIIVSSNSESDTEDVRLRKVYTTPIARAKGKTFFRCYLHAVMHPVRTARRAGQRTIYMKTANSAFQQDFIRNGHGARVRLIRDRGDDKKVEIANY